MLLGLRERDDSDRHERDHEADERNGARPLAARERVHHRDRPRR